MTETKTEVAIVVGRVDLDHRGELLASSLRLTTVIEGASQRLPHRGLSRLGEDRFLQNDCGLVRMAAGKEISPPRQQGIGVVLHQTTLPAGKPWPRSDMKP